MVVLSFDELPKQERPPRRIWNDGRKLREWFEEVERARERQYDPNHRDIEGPVEQNAAAKDLIVG